MIRVKYHRFKGMTGKTYPKFDQVFDRQVPLGEVITRLLEGEEPNCFNCLLASQIRKGLISAVFERGGDLYPINLECFMNAQIEKQRSR